MAFPGTFPPSQTTQGQQKPVENAPKDVQPTANANVLHQSQPVYHAGQPLYSSQPAQSAPVRNHDASYTQPPPSTVAPVQFVNPSFLQNVQPKTEHGSRSTPQQFSSMPGQPSPAPSSHDSPRLEEDRSSIQSASHAILKTSPRKTDLSAVAKPSTTATSNHVDTVSLYLAVAEDCFARANEAAIRVAKHMSSAELSTHHKIVSVGLQALEVVLRSNKLSPRLEARTRLRYAGVLVEETENIMEAETALAEGISTCDKHRFTDLKYCSQFLLLKASFQRNPKAAIKSADSHISDCTTYKHIHWVYAFRFLKAAFFLQSGNCLDPRALNNLRNIAAMAQDRGDAAIYILAQLLEGLAHLSTLKEDAIPRVQACIAAALKMQGHRQAQLPQLEILRLMLDYGCSTIKKVPQEMAQKLSALKAKTEQLQSSRLWEHRHEIRLPIRKQQSASNTISVDTRNVIWPGSDDVDFLVLPMMGPLESMALVSTFQATFALRKSIGLWQNVGLWTESLRVLQDESNFPAVQSLPDTLAHWSWVVEMHCFAQALLGLQAATVYDWERLRLNIQEISNADPPPGFLDVPVLYLKGVFEQGTGNFRQALEIWEDERFFVHRGQATQRVGHAHAELAILASLNRLWILQHPSYQDHAQTIALVEVLKEDIQRVSDVELRTACSLVFASIQTGPPGGIQEQKRYLQQALNGGKLTGNQQCLSIALNIMRWYLFEDVIGEQALKSAKAGLAQAKKSGNLLWMSVAEGMLAKSYEMQGSMAEAQESMVNGTRLANAALARRSLKPDPAE